MRAWCSLWDNGGAHGLWKAKNASDLEAANSQAPFKSLTVWIATWHGTAAGVCYEAKLRETECAKKSLT